MVKNLRSHAQTHLLSGLELNEPLALGHDMVGLDTHNTSAPTAAGLHILIEAGLEVLDETIEIALVLLSNSCQSDARSCLLVHKLSKTRLALHDAVGNVLLATQGWQPNNEFDGVDVMSNDHKLGRFLFNERSHVVEAILEDNRLLRLCVLAVLLCCCSLQETGLLFLPCLRLVLLQGAEQLSSLVLINCHVELIECGWHLETLEEDTLHALQLDVLGPAGEASDITLWLNITSKTEVPWGFLEEWVLLRFLALGATTTTKRGSSDFLACLGSCFFAHA